MDHAHVAQSLMMCSIHLETDLTRVPFWVTKKNLSTRSLLAMNYTSNCLQMVLNVLLVFLQMFLILPSTPLKF